MKINEITLIDSKTERLSVRLTARIGENGDLILDGYDSGEFVEEALHHDDYEYSLTVKAEYKDTILLNLIKEKFKHDAEFRTWLDEKRIPSEFWSF
jgi:spore maturation protein CgeB